jgi:hypothetical protein
MLLSSTHEHVGLTGRRRTQGAMPANNDTLLKDIDVQDVSMVVGVRREDESLDVGALFGKPFYLRGSGPKPRPRPSPPNGPGLMFFQAQAMAFRPGPMHHYQWQ